MTEETSEEDEDEDEEDNEDHDLRPGACCCCVQVVRPGGELVSITQYQCELSVGGESAVSASGESAVSVRVRECSEYARSAVSMRECSE